MVQSHDNDTFFTVNIGIGTPEQMLPVILDTGSSDTYAATAPNPKINTLHHMPILQDRD